MPSTTEKLFTNLAETGPGTAWINPNNILTDSGRADCTVDTATLEVDTPLAGADIPPGQVITDIQITVYWVRDSGSPNDATAELTITGGTTRTFDIPTSLPSGSPTTTTGNLAFWGITEQEAKDFSNGLAGQLLSLRGVEVTAPVDASMYWAKCLFTYVPAPPSDVAPPAVIF